MATLHLALVLALAVPPAEMPDARAPEWTAPPPPPAPVVPVDPQPTSTTSTSPYITSTRPFDPSTPVVTIAHEPSTRQLSRRERKLVWVAGGMTLASIPLFVVMTAAIVKMRRYRSQFDAELQENPSGPFPYDLARAHDRQRDIAIGTSIGGALISTAALVLLFVATRRHRQRGGRSVHVPSGAQRFAWGSR
jgi:hypothetical protein